MTPVIHLKALGTSNDQPRELDLGYYSSLEEQLVAGPNVPRNTLGLYGTHTRGTELVATRAPGAIYWAVEILPVPGVWRLQQTADQL